MRIHTVTGSIAPERLGLCIPHVHLLGVPQERREIDDLAMSDVDRATRELIAVSEAGGGAVVEMGCWDFLDHDLRDLVAISEGAGVAIVATAGCRNGLIGASELGDRSPEQIADRAIADLAGENPEGVPVGTLKVGTDIGELTALDELLFAGIGLAHQRTGAPVLTHSELGALAVEQVRALERSGVAPERVAIGHTDRAGSETQLAVLATGASVVLDQIGKFKYLSADDYYVLIATILDAGYESQLMLSSDFGRCSYFHAYDGDPGLDYIPRQFVGEMLERGIPQASLDAMLVANPARFLAYDCQRPGCCGGRRDSDEHSARAAAH